MQETVNFASFLFPGYVVQDLNLPVHNFHMFWISLSRVGHTNHRIFQHVCTNTYTASPWARWHWRHRWNPSDYDLKLQGEAIWTSNDQPTKSRCIESYNVVFSWKRDCIFSARKGGLVRTEVSHFVPTGLPTQVLTFFHRLCINSWTYSISYLQSSEILKFAGRLVGLISLLLG